MSDHMSIRLADGELAKAISYRDLWSEDDPSGPMMREQVGEPTYTLDGQEITREQAVELLEAEQARQARSDVRPAREWL